MNDMPTGVQGQEPKYRNMVMELDGLASELGTGTTSSSAVTVSDYIGKITTEALTTAQDSKETITWTNTLVAAADLVFVTLANGSNTQGTPVIQTVTPAAGSVTVVIANKHSTAQSLNGTLKLSFLVVKSL
jgi:hypothetical protein